MKEVPENYTQLNIDTKWYNKIKSFRLKYPKNVLCGYLNVNTISNKFDRLMSLINLNLDIFCIAETKLDSSFPTQQFHVPGYSTPFRLDGPKIREASGGLLVYIKEGIPAKPLNKFKLPENCQVLPIEINLRKCKWLLLPIYRPETFTKAKISETISNLIDYYSENYENVLLLGDFNLEATDSELDPLIKSHNLYNLVKSPTCFKSENGRCIDLILTNKKIQLYFNKYTYKTQVVSKKKYTSASLKC